MDEASQYRSEGYCIFRGRLPLDRLDSVAARARELVGYGGNLIRQDGTFSPNDFFEGTKLIRNSPANMHLPLPGDLAPISAALRELLSSRELATCLRKLDAAQHYNVHQSLLFFAAQTTDLHIDSWSVDTAPRGFSHTLWIPLKDLDHTSGSAGVIAWPQGKAVTERELGLTEDGTFRERYERYESAFKALALRDRPEIKTSFLRKGDFFVWSSTTPHLSFVSNPFPKERLSLQVLVMPAHHRRGNFVNQPTEWFRDRVIRINDSFSFYVPENVAAEYGISHDPAG